MPFPRHLVYDNENVALDLRPHWWYFSRHIMTGIPLFVVVVLAFQITGTLGDVVRVPVGILVLAWGIWLGLQYLQWMRTYFVVTDQRVLYRTGVLSRHGVEIPLDRISNINFHQGIWERMIGAGDLDIESAGEQGDTHFDNVRHPDGVQHEVYRQMEVNTRREAGAGADAIGTAVAAAMQHQGPSGGDGDVAAKVDQLARLRDQGHITPAEFEARKNRLLDNL